MRKLTALLLAIVLALGLTACGTEGVSQEEYDALQSAKDALQADYDSLKADNDSQTPTEPSFDEDIDTPSDDSSDSEPVEEFDEDTVLSQLDVKEISYDCGSKYYLLLVTNNSEYDINIYSHASFYDENGELITFSLDNAEAVESGFTALLDLTPGEEFATADYSLSIGEDVFHDCVLSELSYEGTIAKDARWGDELILSVTNNGTEPAEFVKANVLFYKDDKPVYYSYCLAHDKDNELKPGKTITQEVLCHPDFDSYEVYLFGYRYK